MENLNAIQEALETERAKPDTEVTPLVRYPVKKALYKHQIKGANMALIVFGQPECQKASKGFAFLYEMGCGKTLTAIAAIGAMYQERRIKRVLIVAPSSVVAVWSNELEEYADFKFKVQTLLGDKKKRLEGLRILTNDYSNSLKVAVINYESVWRDDVYVSLVDYNADMIICDESQRIKTYNSKQSKAMHRLGDKARYKLILSGTPVQNNAIDLWSQYRFLDSTVFGTQFWSFKARYCQMGGFNDKVIIGYKNLDELIKREYSIAFRVTKKEAIDLPEQVFEVRLLEMSKAERKVYENLKREAYAELENGESITASTILIKLLRLQQLTGGFLVTDNDKSPKQVNTTKIDALKDIIEDYVLESGKKLVVFARFISEIEAIEALCRKLLPKEKKIVSLSGEVKKENRGQIVEQFQTDKDTMIFVGQIDSAGVGITLTEADTCVYYSKNFNYATYEQSLARIHRIGQKNTCTYIDLIVKNSIDEVINNALLRKENLASKIVDNWKNVLKIKEGINMAQGIVKELIDKYEEIRERKERLTKEKTEVEAEYKKIQIELAKAIIDMDEDEATDGDYTYSPRVQTKYSFKSQELLDENEIDKFQVLRENGFDELIKETVDIRTFNSALKEIAENGEEIPEEVLSILNTYDEISISRLKTDTTKRNKLKEAFKRREGANNL